MVDRPTQTDDLDRPWQAADALLAELAARAKEDLAAAVLQGQSYEARVTGSTATPVDPDDRDAGSVQLTPTERAMDRLADAATYHVVVSAFERVAKILRETRDHITPTGKACKSVARDDKTGRLVGCERVATRHGFCAKCWPHVHGGIPPDAAMLRDWNGRLDRDCSCEDAGCPHEPGRCLNRIPAGVSARTCGTCRNRRSNRDVTPSGDYDGTHPFRWHRPA